MFLVANLLYKRGSRPGMRNVPIYFSCNTKKPGYEYYTMVMESRFADTNLKLDTFVDVSTECSGSKRWQK